MILIRQQQSIKNWIQPAIVFTLSSHFDFLAKIPGTFEVAGDLRAPIQGFRLWALGDRPLPISATKPPTSRGLRQAWGTYPKGI